MSTSYIPSGRQIRSVDFDEFCYVFKFSQERLYDDALGHDQIVVTTPSSEPLAPPNKVHIHAFNDHLVSITRYGYNSADVLLMCLEEYFPDTRWVSEHDDLFESVLLANGRFHKEEVQYV